MQDQVLITGIGLVTPLGDDPRGVLGRLEAGAAAAVTPKGFDPAPFGCPVCAPVPDFQPGRYLTETKLFRLMNRDAQFAVVAARLALEDARLNVGADYPADEIALFGATGLAGLPLRDVIPLIAASSDAWGRFDLARFGGTGLRAANPLLSFKILSNMPVCFVSICENIQGTNAVYTPWEGQGAQAIEAGVRALLTGDAQAALVGGCDVKTHELAFLGLQELGVFESWATEGAGVIPGEGAVFLVLENAATAAARGARGYARMARLSLGSRTQAQPRLETLDRVLTGLGRVQAAAVVRGDGPGASREETLALQAAGIEAGRALYPKRGLGDLFAGAAALQVALGAVLAERLRQPVLANCFGYGSEQAAFVLGPP